jgi:hypothetical protein
LALNVHWLAWVCMSGRHVSDLCVASWPQVVRLT